MKTEINENQMLRAIAAMKYLDILTDADIKYFMASDGSRGTEKFYDEVIEAESKIQGIEKLPGKKYSIVLNEVHIDTAMTILLLATEMIGEEEADKHLLVRPLYGKFGDLTIIGEEIK